MLLQPLAENAVRHGVAPLVEGGMILIEARLGGPRLHLAVVNSGPPSPPAPARGIGLGNTAERLKALYGGAAALRVDGLESGGCKVTVELPLRRRA
jgi:LytS/YehU family sensor histidine kinase